MRKLSKYTPFDSVCNNTGAWHMRTSACADRYKCFDSFLTVKQCTVDIVDKLICTKKFKAQLEHTEHRPSTLLLGTHFPAEFSSNPNQTHRNQLLKVFRITWKVTGQVCWSRLEINIVGQWVPNLRHMLHAYTSTVGRFFGTWFNSSTH